MKIRIKVKHLLIVISLCTAIIAAWVFARGYIMLGIANAMDKIGIKDTDIYFGKIAESGFGNASMLAEKCRLEDILSNDIFNYNQYYQISTQSITGSGGYIGYKTLDTVNERYARFLPKGYESKAFKEYTMGTALINWFAGRGENAVSLLEGLSFKNDEKLEQIRVLNLANMYMALGEAEKAKELIEPGLIRLDYFQYCRDTLMMMYYIFKGNIEKAKKYSFDNGKQYEYEKSFQAVYANPLKCEGYIEKNLYDIYKSMNSSKTNNRVYGRIFEDGKPLKNTIVFLKDIRNKGQSSSIPGKHDGIGYYGISDENGYYEINNIANGTYGIVAYMSYQKVIGKNITANNEYNLKFTGQEYYEEDIHILEPFDVKVVQNVNEGTVTFTWDDENSSIEYYSINISEVNDLDDKQLLSNNRFSTDRVYGNSYTLNIQEERKKAYNSGIGYGTSGVEPIQFIEPLYHKGQYSYIIYGYRDELSYGLTYSSKGIYPNRELDVLQIEGQEWTEQDRLLLDKKWEDAIAGYEKVLSEHPDDNHALKVLSRLYNHGYILVKKENGGMKLEGGDKNRALMLLERLDALIDSEYVKSTLAGLYSLSKEYDKSIDIYKELLSGGGTPFYNSRISKNYLYKKDYSMARIYAEELLEKTERGADSLILMGILMDDMELARYAAARFDNKSYYANYDALTEKYRNIDRSSYEYFYTLIRDNRAEEAEKWLEDKEDSLGLFYKGILQLTRNLEYEEREAAYKSFHSRVENIVLSELMKYLGKGMLNTGYGDR